MSDPKTITTDHIADASKLVPQTTPDTVQPAENIIVNDFDSLKHRIWGQIGGHRSDLILAALRSVIDEVVWDSQHSYAEGFHDQLLEKEMKIKEAMNAK